MKKFIKKLRVVDFELVLWVSGLFYLLLIDPFKEQLFTLCPFHNLGIPCMGCGLGRSISFIYHGDLLHSFEAHPLGLLALIVIGIRIIQLSKKYFKIETLQQR